MSSTPIKNKIKQLNDLPSQQPLKDPGLSARRLAMLNKQIASSNDSENCLEKPVLIHETRRRNSSGYKWRGYELTRQELLCLLIFSEGMDNQNTARMLGISIHVVNARSTTLRYRLRFGGKKKMMLATKAVGFSKAFPETLIDRLFDEIQQKKTNKNQQLTKEI